MKQEIIMDKESVEKYKDYTMALALFDGVPVALFFANGLLIHSRFRNKAFLSGVIAAFFGGAAKVAWKVIVVHDKKDVEILTRLFKKLLPGGLSLMTLSGAYGIITAKQKSKIVKAFTPASVACFAAGAAGMGLMGYLGKHMDDSARSNWIEEIANAIGQGAFLAGTIALR